MKNIVICCDGTGSEYGSNNTNVVETFQLVEKDAEQVAYYDPGVGTGGWEYREGATGKLRAMSDKATGTGLQRNVEDAYRRISYLWRSTSVGNPSPTGTVAESMSALDGGGRGRGLRRRSSAQLFAHAAVAGLGVWGGRETEGTGR